MASDPMANRPERPRLRQFAERLTIGRAVGAIVAVAVVLTFISAIVMRLAEPETFTSFGDASWWALQTVTTVGYGDVTPVTVLGRAVAGALMLIGIAVVPAITSIVVAILIARVGERTPYDARLEQRIEELEQELRDR